MKTVEMIKNLEKLRKNQGVHFQNYFYLRCKVAFSTKPVFELMGRHSMFIK